jgi:hypothetical protein
MLADQMKLLCEIVEDEYSELLKCKEQLLVLTELEERKRSMQIKTLQDQDTSSYDS